MAGVNAFDYADLGGLEAFIHHLIIIKKRPKSVPVISRIWLIAFDFIACKR
jgi:hypothetical protein